MPSYHTVCVCAYVCVWICLFASCKPSSASIQVMFNSFASFVYLHFIYMLTNNDEKERMRITQRTIGFHAYSCSLYSTYQTVHTFTPLTHMVETVCFDEYRKTLETKKKHNKTLLGFNAIGLHIKNEEREIEHECAHISCVYLRSTSSPCLKCCNSFRFFVMRTIQLLLIYCWMIGSGCKRENHINTNFDNRLIAIWNENRFYSSNFISILTHFHNLI